MTFPEMVSWMRHEKAQATRAEVDELDYLKLKITQQRKQLTK